MVLLPWQVSIASARFELERIRTTQQTIQRETREYEANGERLREKNAVLRGRLQRMKREARPPARLPYDLPPPP